METEKAIENLKKDIATPLACRECTICSIESLETILKELEKKDKIIDLMAQWISDRCLYEDTDSNYCEITQDGCYEWHKDCKQCIKQYFENKANEEGE